MTCPLTSGQSLSSFRDESTNLHVYMSYNEYTVVYMLTMTVSPSERILSSQFNVCQKWASCWWHTVESEFSSFQSPYILCLGNLIHLHLRFLVIHNNTLLSFFMFSGYFEYPFYFSRIVRVSALLTVQRWLLIPFFFSCISQWVYAFVAFYGGCYHPTASRWRIPSSSFCKADLMLTNTPSFCLSAKVLSSPSTLKVSVIGYKIQGW